MIVANGFGMPSIGITFRKAAQEVNNRSKQGVVGIVLRDTGKNVQGVYTLYGKEELPAALGAANRAYIEGAFTGSELGKAGKVVLAVAGAETAEGGTGALEAALAALAGHSMDYLAGPPDCSAADAAAIKAWVQGQRKQYRTVKAVLPETAADDMGIVNVCMGGAKGAGGTEYTSAMLCARVAGILAGVPSPCSATCVTLPELTEAPAYPDSKGADDPDGAVNAGKYILVHDGMKVKTGRAVNSLQTVPAEGAQDWKKIKIVEAMDLITYFLRTSADDWRGRYPNDYDHQCLLLTAIREFFAELEGAAIRAGSGWCEIDVEGKKQWLKAQGVETAALTDQQIKEADSGSHVFIAFGAQLLDAMEDFAFRGTLA